MTSAYSDILARIEAALEAARTVFARFTPGAIETEYKIGHDPVTEADRAVDAVLRQNLLRDGEGWLSEESVDDLSRLDKSRVWVVDPLDGTREFVAGIPEFCVSIGFVENGTPGRGRNLQSCDQGNIHRRDRFAACSTTASRRDPASAPRSTGSLILASRSEVKRGEWKQFRERRFQIRPMGSVAYKLGTGRGRSRRRYFHSDAEKRVGRRRRSGAGRKRWRFRRHARQYSAALQQSQPASDGPDGQRATSSRRVCFPLCRLICPRPPRAAAAVRCRR